MTKRPASSWCPVTSRSSVGVDVRVDEAGRDRDVADPQVLEVQRGRFAVHADVGDVTAGTGQRGRQLERRRDTDGLDGDVGPEAVGQVAHDRQRVLSTVVDRDVGAELLGGLEPAVGEIDRDDVTGAEQPGAHDRGQADRPGPDHGDHVAGLHVTVEDADLVPGGEDVGEHEHLLVGHTVGDTVGRRVGERHPHVLRLGAVDLVAEDPAAAAEALAVAARRDRTGTYRRR